jgi:hypothetical protein
LNDTIEEDHETLPKVRRNEFVELVTVAVQTVELAPGEIDDGVQLTTVVVAAVGSGVAPVAGTKAKAAVNSDSKRNSDELRVSFDCGNLFIFRAPEGDASYLRNPLLRNYPKKHAMLRLFITNKTGNPVI